MTSQRSEDTIAVLSWLVGLLLLIMLAVGIVFLDNRKVDCVYPEPNVMVCGESLRMLPSTPTTPTETPEIYRRVRQP